MKILIQLLGWLLPLSWRKKLYAKAFGWKFGPGARIGRSLLLCRDLTMGEDAGIGDFNIVRRIDALTIGDHSGFCHLNWITGFATFPTGNKITFEHIKDRKCEIVLGQHTAITSRHFIDCTGGIKVGSFTTIGGVRSQILTHSIDPYESRQTCKPITIGDYCFIGTGSILLPGSSLPNYSILGGGSVLTRKQEQEYALYAGNPACVKKDLSQCEVKYFKRLVGFVS